MTQICTKLSDERMKLMMDMVKIGSKIASARKNAGFTQDELAERIGVTAQAVSKWENGRNLPDLENLLLIAELTAVPYTALLDMEEKTAQYEIRDRLFQEENMYTRVKTTALSGGMTQTYRALSFMREHHAGQYRDAGRYSDAKVMYINHPLMMACQALAFGVRDDALLAAILLHDVVEDTDVSLDQLPFDDEVKHIVDLVTFRQPEGMSKAEAKREYFTRIRSSGKACVVKIIDRCNNVSTMVGKFSRQRLDKQIKETEEYILPLIRELKNNYPEYSDLAFLVKYHIISVLEAVKVFSME